MKIECNEPLIDDVFYFALKRWEDAAIKREERETGRAKMVKKGKAEGERKTKIEMTKLMLKANKDVEEIKNIQV